MKVLKCHKFVLEVEMDKKAEIIPSKKLFYSVHCLLYRNCHIIDTPFQKLL